jgi:nucleoside-diphosphate-sugar epimerase
MADVPHVVHMSSVGAYTPKRDNRPVDESWPTGGVPSSPYSRHKAAAERLLDDHQERHPDRTVTRLRPGIIGQRAAGSALLRYGLPAVVPACASAPPR